MGWMWTYRGARRFLERGKHTSKSSIEVHNMLIAFIVTSYVVLM
jgi:hypothetical protein